MSGSSEADLLEVAVPTKRGRSAGSAVVAEQLARLAEAELEPSPVWLELARHVMSLERRDSQLEWLSLGSAVLIALAFLGCATFLMVEGSPARVAGGGVLGTVDLVALVVALRQSAGTRD